LFLTGSVAGGGTSDSALTISKKRKETRIRETFRGQELIQRGAVVPERWGLLTHNKGGTIRLEETIASSPKRAGSDDRSKESSIVLESKEGRCQTAICRAHKLRADCEQVYTMTSEGGTQEVKKDVCPEEK